MEYRIGDTFKWPGKADLVRLRIREITKLEHWDGPQYTLQLFSVRQYFPDDPAKTTWGWLDSRNDFYFNNDQIDEMQLIIVERGKKPAPVQMELF